MVTHTPPEPLAILLEDIAKLPSGVEVALEILHMHLFRPRDDNNPTNARLVAIGRNLLIRADHSRNGMLRDYGVACLVRICLAGADGLAAARQVCVDTRAAIESGRIFSHDLTDTLDALFSTQPFVALDTFLLTAPSHGSYRLFLPDFGEGNLIKAADPSILQQWANHDPATRYPILGKCIGMFRKTNGEEDNTLSPLFLTLLSSAPDKRLFLGGLWDRIHPQAWSGSLSTILVQRKSQLPKLTEFGGEQAQAWVSEITPALDQWIERERVRDRAYEESFE